MGVIAAAIGLVVIAVVDVLVITAQSPNISSTAIVVISVFTVIGTLVCGLIAKFWR